jgi:exopolyphosphatase/guanosine-5'-triphosphate,3'-diphosphate pyrophosphatase
LLRAGIDIGTNTILLLVAKLEAGKPLEVVEDHVRVVRLGQGVDQSRAFHPDALARARACFAEYAAILKKYPGIEVRAYATSGSRDAKNSAEFFAEVKKDYGIPVRVISGEEEAQLSFQGAQPGDGMDPADMAVLDIGGGSSEIVGLKPNQKDLFRYSFDMGCVRLSERYLKSDPATPAQIQELQKFIRSEFSKQKEILSSIKGKKLVGVAGTATYLASSFLGLSKFDPEKVHGTKLTKNNINLLIERFKGMKAADRLGIGGMDRGRADVILAGAYILEEFMEAAKVESLQVSVRGLRFGAVL